MARIRVLVADDEALVLDAIATFIAAAADMEVSGKARNGQEAIDLTTATSPDVVLMDMQMPILDGVSAIERIHQLHPRLPMLALSSFATDRYVVRALRAGASGYLVKDTPPDRLLAGIRDVMHGDVPLSPQVLRYVVRSIQQEPGQSRAPDTVVRHISERELEVIQLLANGSSNREIAENLYLSEATVKSHLGRITAKLGVRDRVQAVIRAHEWGLAKLRLPE